MNVGIDIIDVKRIGKLIRNRRFLNRVFSANEIKYCSKKKNSAQHFAVRFAAKEAIWKAVGDKSLTHKDICIKNTEQGKPEVLPNKKIKNSWNISISLSHTRDFAVAIAILK